MMKRKKPFGDRYANDNDHRLFIGFCSRRRVIFSSKAGRLLPRCALRRKVCYLPASSRLVLTSLRRSIAEAIAEVGEIDVLVNNAGVGMLNALEGRPRAKR